MSRYIRFFARLLDYSFFLILLDFLCEGFFSYFPDLGYLALLILVPVLWIPMETLFLRFWGRTPGKALAGLKVLGRNKKLSLKESWSRSVISGLSALLFWIPGLNLYLLYRYLRGKALPFEIFSELKVVGYPGLIRKICIVTLSIGLIASNYFEDEIIESIHKSSLPISFHRGETWKEYSSEKGHFSIAFPDKPTSSSSTLPIPGGKQSLPYEEMKLTSDENVTYSVSYTILPKKWVKWKSGLVLKGALKVINSHTNPGKIVDRKHISHQKHPALDFAVKNKQEQTRGRLILIGTYLYKVEMKYLANEIPTEKIDQALSTFVSSFSLTT